MTARRDIGIEIVEGGEGGKVNVPHQSFPAVFGNVPFQIGLVVIMDDATVRTQTFHFGLILCVDDVDGFYTLFGEGGLRGRRKSERQEGVTDVGD